MSAPIDVRVPAPRKPRRVAWVSIRSTTLVGDSLATRGPLRLSGLARSVVEAAAEVWSVPEGDLARLIFASTTLLTAMFNPCQADGSGRALTSPDAWFDDVGLAVMVHSRKYHADGLDWDATVGSGSDLTTAGVPSWG